MPAADAPLPPAGEIARLQIDAVRLWHQSPIVQPHAGFLSLVSQQHEQNFRLWHEEDEARSPFASDQQIAALKRNIDRLNQQRNDLIEKLDDAVAEVLEQHHVRPSAAAAINTETPGSVIDRLSILSLRWYHYQEQLERPEVDASHRALVASRLQLCRQQHVDLVTSLQRLLDDLSTGRLRHKTYRQMKMYNDPALNPVLYQGGRST